MSGSIEYTSLDYFFRKLFLNFLNEMIYLFDLILNWTMDLCEHVFYRGDYKGDRCNKWCASGKYCDNHKRLRRKKSDDEDEEEIMVKPAVHE